MFWNPNYYVIHALKPYNVYAKHKLHILNEDIFLLALLVNHLSKITCNQKYNLEILKNDSYSLVALLASHWSETFCIHHVHVTIVLKNDSYSLVALLASHYSETFCNHNVHIFNVLNSTT